MKRTPLARGKKPLNRGRGLAARSPGRQAEEEEWQLVAALVRERDDDRCRARTLWPEVRCAGPRDPHHVEGRDTERQRLDPDLIVLLCRRHHDAVHFGDPIRARALGLLR